jgi:hypothetical protein
MMGVIRLLFPSLDRRSDARFRDARVRDSVARSEQVLATHDLLTAEVAAIERMLARKELNVRRESGG